MNRIVIDNGTLVNEGRRFNGYIVIEGDRIARIGAGRYPGAQAEIGSLNRSRNSSEGGSRHCRRHPGPRDRRQR